MSKRFFVIVMMLCAMSFAVCASTDGGILSLSKAKGGAKSALTVPFSCPFATQAEFDAWTVIDVNNDRATWKWDAGLKNAKYSFSSSNAANDWLISPAVTLEAGKKYRLSFEARSNADSYPESMKVYMGKGTTVAAQDVFLADYPSLTGSFDRKSIVIEPSETGDYNIGFYACSKKNMSYLHLKNVMIENATAPGSVTNLSLTPGANGQKTATIAFKTPTVNVGGDALGSIGKVEVFRGQELVKTFVAPGLGEMLSYVDNVATSGKYDYKVIATNDAGAGNAEVVSGFIGEDVVKAPVNILLTRQGNDAVLKWEVPEGSANGGWANMASLSYKITRMPDNVVVGESVVGLEYRDLNLTAYRNYYYKIQAKTTAGAGGEGVSNAVNIGNSLQIPYVCGFDVENEFNIWTVVNSNDDASTWKYDGTGKFVVCQYNSMNDSDDWIISPPVVLEAGVTYRVRFEVKAGGVSYSESLKVYYGQGASVEAQQVNLLSDSPKINSMLFEQRSAIIKPTVTGDYNVGFYACSAKNKHSVSVDNVVIERVADNDMSAVSIVGSLNPMINKEYVYSVEVKNMGVNKATGYKVELLNANDVVLSELVVNEPLMTEESNIVKLRYTPNVVGSMALRGRVTLANDNLLSNNETSSISINVKPTGDTESVEILFANAKEDKTLPINFYYKASASQTIYLAEEIAMAGGLIKKITYPYNNKNAGSYIKPVKMYMCSTELEDFSEGWIGEENLTLVFDGEVEIKPGVGQLEIVLPVPYVHTGGNLCIMNVRPLDVSYINNVLFSLGDTYKPRAIRYQSDTENFTFGVSAGMKLGTVPNVKIDFDNVAGGNVRGKVVSGGQAVEGAEVVLQPYNMRAVTNNLGEYSFAWVPVGKFNLTVAKYGYVTHEQADIEVVANSERFVNTELFARPSYTVTGIVSDKDGNKLAGAVVSLKGYKNYVVSTDNRGVFTMEHVYTADGYEIKVVRNGFSSYKSTVNVQSGDLDLPIIMLTDIPNAPVDVVAEASISEANVSWGQPSDKRLYRYDDGKLTGKLGFTSGTAGNGAMGSVHRVPSILSSMSWYTIGEEAAGGPHATVNVFVFDLDETGEPTTKVLFKQFGVPNVDDEWSSFTFPEPVECPNGFMIGIGYAGFVGIGLDSGVDTEYPFVENGNYRIGNYMTGTFIVNTAAENIAANYMIRAEGYEMNEVVAGDGSKSINGYKIWRFAETDQATEENWTLLTQSPIRELSYVDHSWGDLGSGGYRYAVRAAYSNGVYSQAAFSNALYRDMNTGVSLHVTTNTPINDSEGAKVVLTNNDNKPEHVYTATVDSEGKATIGDMWKGVYKVVVSHEGYTTIEDTKDLSVESSYELEYALNEVVEEPFNLKIVENEYPTERILSWNVDDDIFDDFESHSDFRINSPGELKWSYIDADGGTTQSFSGVSFPNAGDAMAYIVFNPKLTIPALTPTQAPSIQPHSGDKFLASFASNNKPNSDYLISPELSFAKEFTLSFWAKTQTAQYGLERMKVGYSFIGTEAEHFRDWLTGESYVEVPATWTKYTYTVPAGAKYVTIQCVSNDAFVFMVDDVFIGLRPESSKSLQRYEVYLDGEKQAEVNTNSYLLTDLSIGKHVAGVKAVYATATTDMQTVEFEVTGVQVAAAVSGQVEDVNGGAMSGVKVTITGERIYETTTDGEGQFAFAAVMAQEAYRVSFAKEGYGEQVRMINVVAGQDVTMETVVMGEDAYKPKKVFAEVDDMNVAVSWVDGTTATEDVFRYDDGVVVNGLGSNTGSDKTIVGNVFTTPASLTKITWLTAGSATKVNVFVFDVTEDGKPTNTILYKKTNVSTTANSWSSLTLDDAVQCPRGFFAAVSISAPVTGNVALGVDTGISEEWPFVPNVGYFSPDYTAGSFQYTGAMFTKNLMIRAEGFIIDSDNKTKVVALGSGYNVDENMVSSECIGLNMTEISKTYADNAGAKSLTGYNVWRLDKKDVNNEKNWVLLTNTPVTSLNFIDSEWKTVVPGSYVYAVRAIYTGGVISEPGFSNAIERPLTSKITINVRIKDTDIAVKNATVKLTNNDGVDTHVYNTKTNNAGLAAFPKVYKGIYKVEIKADGYNPFVANDKDLSTYDDYNLDYSMTEIIAQPINIEVSKTDVETERIISWTIDNEEAIVRNAEVYLDNAKVGETKERNYKFTNLTEGKHTAGVKLVYLAATSELQTVSFEVFVSVETMHRADIMLYPNPFTDYIKIDGEYESMEIYDMAGKMVMRAKNSKHIDAKSLPCGVYTIKVSHDKGISTYKMVK